MVIGLGLVSLNAKAQTQGSEQPAPSLYEAPIGKDGQSAKGSMGSEEETQAQEIKHAPGEVLVKFKEGVNPQIVLQQADMPVVLFSKLGNLPS